VSTTTSPPDSIASLERKLGRSWSAITASHAAADAERTRIAGVVTQAGLVPADCAFVVFGSLARGEVTPGSDVDWTLLVDGQADPQHVAIAQSIKAKLDELETRSPGPTQVFGELAFSHDLIHQIGGEADTNRSTTRRILLLLESRELSESGVRERVMRGLLRRYLDEDLGYHELHGWQVRVPRFLLNDIVRFWRTMAVDYAAKRRDRGGAGWAIRNFKLRMSRKLIFTAGLAMCMICELAPSSAVSAPPPRETAEFYRSLQDFLIDFANRTPLDVIAGFALALGAATACGELLDAYDAYLAILMNAEHRSRLDKMEIDQAVGDPLFLETRRIGNAFQDALTNLFFHSDPRLTTATQRYGVF
jgi:predicted nucleotidyltransferase